MPRVYLREPATGDAAELTALNLESQELHRGWVSPPVDHEQYNAYLERLTGDQHRGFLICRVEDHAITGVANLNNVIRGAFQNAFLGYYGSARFAGQGLMTEGLALVLDYAFDDMALHRVEANIQPENTASVRIVRKLGFELEGYSRGYLKICGAWRDHERYAMRSEMWNRTSK